MTTWVKPFYYHGLSIGNQLSSSAGSLDLDAVTSATPLVTGTESLSNLFLGNVGGCIGETSALALLLGGLFLIFTRIISPSTPIAYLGSLGILTFFHALATGGSLTEVPYALLSGGVMIGAFFMATDYVTTPITTKGKWIFGIGCGILTFVIREFASMPEGCSFSILLMNLLTPYIDKFIKPPVVLAVVCACCCGLLAVANSVTKDKIAAAEAASIQASLQQLPNAGNFTEVSDFQPANNEKATATAVYVDENQQTAVLVTANGYNKGGLQVVIGLDAEGTVTGITFVSVTETPGLGTKVQSNPELLTDHLVGLSDAAAVEQVDGITGATYSSNGMKAAVTCAMETFAQSKEAILS